MDGGKKKRKMEEEEYEEKKVIQEDYNDDDEEKMEQFFALIKSTREVRDRIAAAGNRGKPAGDKAAGTWNPTFKLEDFMEVPPPEKAAADADRAGPSSPAVGEGDKRQGGGADEMDASGGGGGLDLNLSL